MSHLGWCSTVEVSFALKIDSTSVWYKIKNKTFPSVRDPFSGAYYMHVKVLEHIKSKYFKNKRYGDEEKQYLFNLHNLIIQQYNI